MSDFKVITLNPSKESEQENNKPASPSNNNYTTSIKNNITKQHVHLKSFYNKHFPTDRKTFNVRVPFIGWVLSILTFHIVTSLCFRRYYYDNGGSSVLGFSYILLSFGPAYELYNGLLTGDRKQFTYWFVLKLVEIAAISVSIIVLLATSYSLWRAGGELTLGIITLLLNSLATYFVVSYMRQLKDTTRNNSANNNYYNDNQRRNDLNDENIYDQAP